jgi:hypothetical protein
MIHSQFAQEEIVSVTKTIVSSTMHVFNFEMTIAGSIIQIRTVRSIEGEEERKLMSQFNN